MTYAASSANVKNWKYHGVDFKNTKAAAHSIETSVNDDSLSIKYFQIDKKYFFWFEYNDNYSILNKRAEFFIRTKNVSGSGRYSSDYVFKGKVIVQPNIPSNPQLIVAELTYEDIQAIKKYSGNNIGVGYFNQDNMWRTYLFPGKNLWSSYSQLTKHVRNSNIPKKAPAKRKYKNAMDAIYDKNDNYKSNQMSDEELKKHLNGKSFGDAFVDWMAKNPKNNN
jgi:hypothetical protein